MRVVKSTPEEQHADQDKCRGNRRTDKMIAVDALTATEAGAFVIDIKTIPAFFISPTNAAKVQTGTECLTFSAKTSADRQPDSQRRTDGSSVTKPPRHQTRDRQHAQEQIQQKQKQNINLSRPQRWTVPIRFSQSQPHITRRHPSST